LEILPQISCHNWVDKTINHDGSNDRYTLLEQKKTTTTIKDKTTEDGNHEHDKWCGTGAIRATSGTTAKTSFYPLFKT